MSQRCSTTSDEHGPGPQRTRLSPHNCAEGSIRRAARWSDSAPLRDLLRAENQQEHTAVREVLRASSPRVSSSPHPPQSSPQDQLWSPFSSWREGVDRGTAKMTQWLLFYRLPARAHLPRSTALMFCFTGAPRALRCGDLLPLRALRHCCAENSVAGGPSAHLISDLRRRRRGRVRRSVSPTR